MPIPSQGPSLDPISVLVRPRLEGDLVAIVALAERVYPLSIHVPEAVWPEESLREHMHRFPEGQLVALDGQGKLLGDSTSLRVPLDAALAPHTWAHITGRGRLTTHDPSGDALYGVDIMVEPALQGRGIGAQLYLARIALGHRLGCRAFVAGARIPGYHLVANRLSPEAYVAEVAAGHRFDPTLSRQLRQGFEVRGLLPNYFRDPESMDQAVLIFLPLD